MHDRCTPASFGRVFKELAGEFRYLKYSHRALKNEFILEAHRQGVQLLVRVIEDNPQAASGGEALNVKVSILSHLYV
jgi:hypothetical protein